MFHTSENRNNEIVTVKLSIGQCKLLESLADAELFSVEAGSSTLNENALKGLIDVFHEKTKPTNEESKQAIENWVGRLKSVGANHG